MINQTIPAYNMNDRGAGWHEVEAKTLKVVCQYLPTALLAKVEWKRRFGYEFGRKPKPIIGL